MQTQCPQHDSLSEVHLIYLFARTKNVPTIEETLYPAWVFVGYPVQIKA